MQLRSFVLLLTVLAIAALAALNWPALAAPSLVSLGVVSFEAPLGLLMLALTTLLGIFFLAYVLSLQGSVLLETRRHTKELQAQRGQAHAAVLARLDHLEARLAARAEESDNTTAAYVGQLEQQLRSRHALGTPVV